MNIITTLEQDSAKLKAWVLSHEPKFIADITTIKAFCDKVLAWRKTAQGTAAIAVLEAEIPTSISAISGATQIITALSTDMAACTNPAAWSGIALRLGAEILSLADGGKLPTGISGYIQEMQNIFVG